MGDLREPITRRYLTPIPREPKPSAYHSVFALPKYICMFINICSLSKTKNKAKAVVALEADMCPNDVNQCACGNGNAPQTSTTGRHIKHGKLFYL